MAIVAQFPKMYLAMHLFCMEQQQQLLDRKCSSKFRLHSGIQKNATKYNLLVCFVVGAEWSTKQATKQNFNQFYQDTSFLQNFVVLDTTRH